MCCREVKVMSQVVHLQVLLKNSRNKLLLLKSELTSVDTSASVLYSLLAMIRSMQMGGGLAVSATAMSRLHLY